MIILLRLSALLLAAFVSFATLGPPGYRPHSHLGQNGEHALAFLLVGLAFGLVSAGQRRLVLALLLVWTAAIEVLQFWAPGRHARLSDFIVDALAASVGLALASGWSRLKQLRLQPGE